MPKNHTFIRDDVMPSYWANAIQEFIGAASFGVRPARLDATTVEVDAGPGNDQVGLAIEGLWRFRDSAVTRAHPAGAAGVYGIWAVAKAESVGTVPLPFTDSTDYEFDLRIVPVADEPALVAGVVDVIRKIGETVWDGAAITRVRSLLPSVAATDPVEPSQVFGEAAVHAPERNRIVAGAVDAAGAIIRGAGFTCIRTATGVYAINFEDNFAEPVDGVANQIFVSGPVIPRFFVVGGSSAAGVVFYVVDQAGGFHNEPFSFVVSGLPA